MDKIILTKEELDWALADIRNRRNGLLIDYQPTSQDDPCITVLQKASALEGRLNAIDERIDNYNGDLILWFISRYVKQEGLPLKL